MYRVDDLVLYSAQGVCKITDIAMKKINGEVNEYYILKPVYNENAIISVPVHNEKAMAKMRRALSIDEIYRLIRTMPDKVLIWIDNDNLRKEKYRNILKGSDRAELISLIKTLYIHQQEQQQKGRKLHNIDEQIFVEAEKILYEEFAYVLKIERDQVLPFILKQIEVEKRV